MDRKKLANSTQGEVGCLTVNPVVAWPRPDHHVRCEASSGVKGAARVQHTSKLGDEKREATIARSMVDRLATQTPRFSTSG